MALLKLVQVNQVRRKLSNIKSPFYDIQNDSEFNCASPEKRVNNYFVTQNQINDPNFNACDLWKLRNCQNGLSNVNMSYNLKPLVTGYS